MAAVARALGRAAAREQRRRRALVWGLWEEEAEAEAEEEEEAEEEAEAEEAEAEEAEAEEVGIRTGCRVGRRARR